MMVTESKVTEEGSETLGQREPSEHVLAFVIGALVGAGIAAVWVPERRRRQLPEITARRYRRVRRAGAATLDELREAGREIGGEFREELGTLLEAAREEFQDMTRAQLEQVGKALRPGA